MKRILAAIALIGCSLSLSLTALAAESHGTKCVNIQDSLKRLTCFDEVYKDHGLKVDGVSSEIANEHKCKSFVEKALLNPETLEMHEISTIDRGQLDSLGENLLGEYRIMMSLVEIQCIREGNIDDTLKAMCMFSNEPDHLTKRREQGTAIKELAANEDFANFFTMRIRADAAGGAKFTKRAACGTNENGSNGGAVIFEPS